MPEWAIVELQGDLEARSYALMSEQYIGDLYYNKYGAPILVIGHHILQGREQKLDKPFAVLEKSKSNERHLLDTTMASTLNRTSEPTILDNTVTVENKTRQRTEYTVQAICTKKIIFKARPKPIIANVAKIV